MNPYVAPSRRTVIRTGAAVALVPALTSALPSQAGSRPPAAAGFDFLMGKWDVRHRRLKSPLSGESRWITFPGTLDVRPILQGLGNIDDNLLGDPAGHYLASSLRVFDRNSGNWSIYWLDARSPALDPPLVGRFDGRVGHFYNDDTFAGRPIRVRFSYENAGPRVARWSQAFSPDRGRNWEINWTMDFTRPSKSG